MIEIQSYKSVGPLQFGMNEVAVRLALGEPVSSSTDRQGNQVLRYKDLNCTLGPEGLLEVGVLPELPVRLRGIDLFNSPTALEAVCEMDGCPQEFLGFLVFMKLGVTMTGFHDQDESQKAVTAFASGRWDILMPQMKPFHFVAGAR